MSYDIIVGRNEPDRKSFGKEGTIFIGKQYVKMGSTTSLANEVFMDVNRSHVVLISGKRGSGKSYSLGTIAEEIANLSPELKKNISVLIFDTMGIFWTMRYENEKDADLLEEWGLKTKELDIDIYTPRGYFNEYRQKGIPTDFSFSIKPSELSASDWSNVFGISLHEPIGVLIERVINKLSEGSEEYSIKDIVSYIQADSKSEDKIKSAAENRFSAVDGWGLFSEEGIKIKNIIKPGRVSVVDISCYTNTAGSWSVKGLVIGLLSRKLLQERMTARKVEELEQVNKKGLLFSEQTERKDPLVWILIDEAHEFLPKEGKTPATDALVQILREGRQPGLSLILATQQPGEIHKDVLTQSDVVLSHKLTAKSDIDALNSMMQSYLVTDLQKSLNDLPKQKGSGIILDDNSERLYSVQIRPRFTWHGGEAPTALSKKKKLDLGL